MSICGTFSSCCASGSVAVEAPLSFTLGDIGKTQLRESRSREEHNKGREGFRACRASSSAGNPPCTKPVKAVPKRSYANTVSGDYRVALSNTPFKRGKQRTGGTGAAAHPSSFISVQYSSFAVQQYVAAQQCKPSRSLAVQLSSPCSTAQQHPAPSSCSSAL